MGNHSMFLGRLSYVLKVCMSIRPKHQVIRSNSPPFDRIKGDSTFLACFEAKVLVLYIHSTEYSIGSVECEQNPCFATSSKCLMAYELCGIFQEGLECMGKLQNVCLIFDHGV